MPNSLSSGLSEVVVVVDDDPAVLNALKFAFEVEGFGVHAFRTAEAALAAERMPERGCLVVDYRLPGIDGLEMLRRLRRRGVDLPAVLITTPTLAAVRAAAVAQVPIVEKPLVAGALIDKVRVLLDGGRLAAGPDDRL